MHSWIMIIDYISCRKGNAARLGCVNSSMEVLLAVCFASWFTSPVFLIDSVMNRILSIIGVHAKLLH